MMSVPPTEHLWLLVPGTVVILQINSYLTVRTLEWRAGVRHLEPPSLTRSIGVMVLGLHLFVLLGSGGLLAALRGLPATGRLLIVGGVLIGVYIPPLLLAIGLLTRLLRSPATIVQTLPPSSLSNVELGITFAGWNLAIFPSIAVLRLLLG